MEDNVVVNKILSFYESGLQRPNNIGHNVLDAVDEHFGDNFVHHIAQGNRLELRNG